MTKDEALKLALKALEKSTKFFNIVRLGQSRLKDTEIHCFLHEAMTAIKATLEQPSQEPVFLIYDGCGGWIESNEIEYSIQEESNRFMLYTTPQQRPWVGLTEDEMQMLWDRYAHMEMMRAIEAKLKEKNFD